MGRIFLLTWVFLLSVTFCPAGEGGWQKKDAGISEKTIISVTANEQLLAATEKAVYISSDNALSWQRVLSLNEGSNKINALAGRFGADGEGYIATSGGLYKISAALNKAERVFKGWGEAKDVACVEIGGGDLPKIYAGTGSGLYISDDSARRWRQIPYFKNKSIKDILFLNDCICVAADDGIHKGSIIENCWNRIFIIKKSKEEFDNEDGENTEEPEERDNTVNCLKFDEKNNILYAGCSKGIFASSDGGSSWNKLPSSGIINEYIEEILLFNNRVMAATRKGVFLLDNKPGNEWQMLEGLAYYIYSLAFDAKTNCVYAATKTGVYAYSFETKKDDLTSDAGEYADLIKKQMNNEPEIRQIQQAAVEYAEVNPDKIKNMREAAKNKAWMPKVSIGFDYDGNNNIDVDRRGTNDPDAFIIGPEDKSWGCGIDLSWDLGELVWNQDQTSIDVRSRLMVQLRDDILTEVTGLYFERKKLQMDMADGKYNEKLLQAQRLRLDELTARVDALTGGYLSACGRKDE